MDEHGYNLLMVLEDIKPDKLGSISHEKYVSQLAKSINKVLRDDSTKLLILVQVIKDCKKPCYKRDVLLEVLNSIILSDQSIIDSLFCDTFQNCCNRLPWREMANAITSLPDLIANCNALDKLNQFKANKFYTFLLRRLYNVMGIFLKDLSRTKHISEQKAFYLQIIGKIALSGHTRSVWEEILMPVMQEKQEDLRGFVVDTLRIPLVSDDKVPAQFEIFIEPLYLPIFYYLKPSKESGNLIKTILGDTILSHKTLEYAICRKSIFQTHYTQDKLHQKVVLFNIFSYISVLANNDKNNPPKPGISLLVMTLLNIVDNWSNVTKILLRSYEHSRYICYSLVIAFRYALEFDKQGLAENSTEIQTKLMKGIPVYLNRASKEQRNLAMCVGEIFYPRLHEVVDDHQKKGSPKMELDFNVPLDEDCEEIKGLFSLEIEILFQKFDNRKTDTNTEITASSGINNENKKGKNINDVESEKTLKDREKSTASIGRPPNRAVIELDDGEEDLKPIHKDECDVINTDEEEDDEAIRENINSVPIYLQDCINGLVDNSNPRYVRLCLIKAGELISQLSETAALNDKSVNLSNQNKFLLDKPCGKEAIRDTAIELAQILLYIDDQFEIDNFEAHRMKALISLCIAAPDLIVKYLLDEFNGSNRSIRHQLDILQVMVASARHLSGENNYPGMAKINEKSSNEFVKYASLCFYGIVHRLKADLNSAVLPTTIVSAAKSLADSSMQASGRRATMIRRVIDGIANSNSQVDKLSENFSLSLPMSAQLAPLANKYPNESLSVKEGKEFKENSTKSTSQTSRSSKSNTDTRESDKKGEHWIDDGQRLREEDNDKLDDSYLLCRILFSISLIIKCLYQQPITCKLSNDLLDILAAYRCHPDSGVRKAIVSCLTVMRDCTPSVYFEEYLHDKIMCLFGQWMSNESEMIGQLRLR